MKLESSRYYFPPGQYLAKKAANTGLWVMGGILTAQQALFNWWAIPLVNPPTPTNYFMKCRKAKWRKETCCLVTIWNPWESSSIGICRWCSFVHFTSGQTYDVVLLTWEPGWRKTGLAWILAVLWHGCRVESLPNPRKTQCFLLDGCHTAPFAYNMAGLLD